MYKKYSPNRRPVQQALAHLCESRFDSHSYDVSWWKKLEYIHWLDKMVPSAWFQPRGSNIFRWSPDVSTPWSWHPPVGGSAVVVKPLLFGSRPPLDPLVCHIHSSTRYLSWSSFQKGIRKEIPLWNDDHSWNKLELQISKHHLISQREN